MGKELFINNKIGINLKNNGMFKQRRLVMVPTNQLNAPICIYKGSGKPTTDTHKLAYHQNQHLYLLSNEKVNEGDWVCYPKYTDPIRQYKEDEVSHKPFKIIGTTNKFLDVKIGNISQDFINEFCDEGGIYEVLVKYTYNVKKISIGWSERSDYRPKLTSDGTIILKTINKNWSNKEVKGLLIELDTKIRSSYGVDNDGESCYSTFDTKKWLEEKL